MGYEIQDEVGRFTGLRGASYRVLIALAQHADEVTRQCYPKIDTIALETGYSRRSVIRSINALEDLGLIQKQRGAYVVHTRGGDQSLNVYTVMPIATSEKDSKETHSSTDDCPLNGDVGGIITGSDKNGAKGVTRMSLKGVTRVSPRINQLESGIDNQEIDPFSLATKRPKPDPEALIRRGCELVGDAGPRQQSYLATVYRDWMNLFGADKASSMLATAISNVESAKSCGKIRGSVGAYLCSALTSAREIEIIPSQAMVPTLDAEIENVF